MYCLRRSGEAFESGAVFCVSDSGDVIGRRYDNLDCPTEIEHCLSENLVGATVWTFSDVANGLMALPNLIGLLILSPLVYRETKAYSERKDPVPYDPATERIRTT